MIQGHEAPKLAEPSEKERFVPSRVREEKKAAVAEALLKKETRYRAYSRNLRAAHDKDLEEWVEATILAAGPFNMEAAHVKKYLAEQTHSEDEMLAHVAALEDLVQELRKLLETKRAFAA